MDKKELSKTSIKNGQDAEPQELEEKEEQLCWHCKKDTDKSKLICPCKCANKFIHIQCLEIVANTGNICDCRTCETRYPLEIQRRSLLEMILKTRIFVFFCNAFFVMLFGMLLICIPLWVISKNMSDDQYLYLVQSMVQLIQDPFILFVIIINIIAFGLNYMIAPYVIGWSKRIYELFDEWHRSTYEWKLIEGYNVNIQDIKKTV